MEGKGTTVMRIREKMVKGGYIRYVLGGKSVCLPLCTVSLSVPPFLDRIELKASPLTCSPPRQEVSMP